MFRKRTSICHDIVTNCKNSDKWYTMHCKYLHLISIQGFRGDEKIGDVVRCAMFSNAFPSVKSPQELAFEAEMESVVKEGDVNIDELSAAEFIMDGKSEQDDAEMIDVVEQLGLLEDLTEWKKKCNRKGWERETIEKRSRKRGT